MNHELVKLLATILAVGLLGCSGNSSLPDFSAQSNKQQNWQASGRGNQQFGSGDLFGDGGGNFFETGQEEGDFVYPEFKFTGAGTLHHRGGSNPIKQSMTGRVDKTTFSFETTDYHATGGKHSGEVNGQLQAKVYGQAGIAEGNRALASDLGAKGSEFVWAKFLIYAKDIRNTKKGETYQFNGDFIPVTVVPGARSRYDSVFSSSSVLTYRAQVTGSHNFQLLTTVSLLGASDDWVEVELVNEIVGDSNCTIAGSFPLPRSVSYRIDTTRKLVTEMRNAGNYNDQGKCYSTSAQMRLCETKKGEDPWTPHEGGC